MDTAEIRELLRQVYDPELGINIVDLGLVYEIQNEDGDVYVRMTLTTPGCPMHDTIAGGVERLLERQPGIRSVRVDVVWDPPWSPEMMSEEAKERLGFCLAKLYMAAPSSVSGTVFSTFSPITEGSVRPMTAN